MSITLSQITNDNTFGIWKDRTNSIITGLATVVTLGDTDSNNTGNIALTGNVTAGGFVKTDTLDALGAGNLITINANTKTNGDLSINKAGATTLGFYNSDALTWKMSTSADHLDLFWQLGSGATAKILKIDSNALDSGTTAVLTGTNIRIANGILPTSFTQNTTGNASTATTLATARAIALTGDVAGTADFDGSGDISITAIVANGSHTHTAGDITDLSTTLSGYALKSGASFVGASGVVKVGYNDYIQLGGIAGSGDNSQAPFVGSGSAGAGIGDAYVKYGSSFGGSARFMTIGLTPTGSASTTPAGMILELRGKSLSIRNNDVVKISMDGSTGSITAAGDITAFHTFSDRRLKENIVKIENPLDKILQISGYTFNYIGDDKPMTGVIAQEIEEVLPEVVYEAEAIDGTSAKAVRHGNIVGLLIEAIKELKAEVEELKKDK